MADNMLLRMDNVGIGKASLPAMEKALREHGLSFKEFE